MAETKSKGQKDKLDRFYTKDEVAKQCIDLLYLDNYDTIIEPSAGGGAFSRQIDRCIAYDLAPAAQDIIEADWLSIDKTQFQGKSLVIGNPPFGQQNTLALSFINSSTFADTIAFILPLSFKKVSVQNKIDLYFSLAQEFILPKNSFLLDEKEYDVPAVFQIWMKQEKPRKKIVLPTKTELFDFTDKTNADFRIQRVGGNAGKASFDLERSPQSNYFIKNKTSLSNEEFVDIVNNTSFPSITFTVGPKSLSKGELIDILEDRLTKM